METKRQKPVRRKFNQKLQQSSLLPQQTSMLSTDVMMLLPFAISIRLLQSSLLDAVSIGFDIQSSDRLCCLSVASLATACYLLLYFCLIYMLNKLIHAKPKVMLGHSLDSTEQLVC